MALGPKNRYFEKCQAFSLRCIFVKADRTVPRFTTAALLLIIGGLFVSCSPTQDSFTAGIYHNVTARYNGYFYAREDIRAIEARLIGGMDDDHNTLLRLFPKLDTTQAKSYEQESEEAIKMASIAIQRHPNSRWVYPAYILVGVARLYRGEYPEAIRTLKYVNTKCNDADIRHEALIYLMRTFIESGDYAKALETADFLNREKLSKSNAKNLYLEKAYFYQIQNDYDKMVQNLTAADTLLTRYDRRARIYFIVGQVYQKIGFKSEAYNYYRKCLDTNPEYEIDFYARLNMAQVTSVEDAGKAQSIRKQFARMLADEKNKEFKDKIYFEIAEFELRQGKLAAAMENYKSCLHSGTSQRVQGMGYLRLGQIYYDSSRKYSLAKAYYDSAVNSLPEDTEGLADIKKRQSILGEFAEYTETIQLQDSLLALAKMDTAVLHRQMDSTRTAQKLAESTKKTRKKGSRSNSEPSDTRISSLNPTAPTTTTIDWYFGNASAVALGQSEFQRIWGAIKLEDNWRRSVKSTLNPGEVTASPGMETAKTIAAPGENAAEEADPFDLLYAQLPLTKEQQDTALAKIELAYFKLGDLYYFRLNEKSNAIQTYLTLLGRFPESKFRAEILYKLYLAARETGPAEAKSYRDELIEKFPNSTFTRLVLNPNYLEEEKAVADKQKALYREAYALLNAGQITTSRKQIEEALQLGDTEFVPQLKLLNILVTGRTEDITLYQLQLSDFIKVYDQTDIGKYASTLLNASRTFQEKAERSKGIRFTRDLNQVHQVVVVHNRDDNLTSPLTDLLEKFNVRHHSKANFIVSNLALSETLTMTFVLEFADKGVAASYLDAIRNDILEVKPMLNHKLNSFVITKENFGIFYRTRALEEYLAFYEQNYQP